MPLEIADQLALGDVTLDLHPPIANTGKGSSVLRSRSARLKGLLLIAFLDFVGVSPFTAFWNYNFCQYGDFTGREPVSWHSVNRLGRSSTPGSGAP